MKPQTHECSRLAARSVDVWFLPLSNGRNLPAALGVQSRAHSYRQAFVVLLHCAVQCGAVPFILNNDYLHHVTPASGLGGVKVSADFGPSVSASFFPACNPRQLAFNDLWSTPESIATSQSTLKPREDIPTINSTIDLLHFLQSQHIEAVLLAYTPKTLSTNGLRLRKSRSRIGQRAQAPP